MEVTLLRTSEQRFRKHLQIHANRYFNDLSENSVEVDLVRKAERHNSQLYEFRLTGRHAVHLVIVKVPFTSTNAEASETQTGSNFERPRLFPKPIPHLKGLFEYRSLRAIHDHFAQLDDPRFGAIRILDFLDDPYTVIMEKGHDQSFRGFFRKTHRLCPDSLVNRLVVGCRNSGAWLNEFRNLSPLEHCEVRYSKSEEMQDALDALIMFASNSVGRRWLCPLLLQRLQVAAETLLPARLPLGMIHTDFAPRNILLGHDGRVTVFDSTSRWMAPIYVDLAYFLIRLKASMPQMMSQGLLFDASTLTRFETEFIRGYFGQQPVPMAQIRLFECFLLLEQWAAMVCRLRMSGGVHRIAMHCQIKLAPPFLRHYIHRNLSEIAV